MKIAPDITKAVGNTPLVELSRLNAGNDSRVLGKLESANPTSSVKDRIAVWMVDAAEASGKLKPGSVIIEPTSGNTGIGLAFVAAARGYRLILTMPESMSLERRAILRQFGAELVLTEASKGMKGAIEKAVELAGTIDHAFIPQQFTNPANPLAHYQTTGPEIWEATEGQVDILVAGVGTGGSITGIGRYLKEHKPEVKVIAVEPVTSAVLSGDPPGKHAIQGIGAGFIPDVLDRDLLDEVIKLPENAAFETARLLARKEGILAGISAGGNVWAALQVAARPTSKGKTIVTLICDTGERYLSTRLFENN